MKKPKQKKKPKKPLKHFKSGLEFEFFLLDEKGLMQFNADELIKKTKELESSVDIVKEAAFNMIELNHYPKIEPHETVHDILSSYRVLLEAAEQLETKIFPLGTYPGVFEPKMRKEKFYRLKEKVFGKEKFKIAGRNIGFHFHHTLPKGVFDKQKLRLRKLVDSKLKRMLMNAYNLLIAFDPALICLTQSSPYYQGTHYGKDSRIFWYRGGRKLHFMKGLYAKYHLVGQLPPYKQTLSDLKFSMAKRYTFWQKQLVKAGFKASDTNLYKSLLDVCWNPVKVNKHDTLEQRGMDMNYVDNVMGVTTVLNYILNKVQKGRYEVIPSDIGLEEPFKIEGKLIYIPPHTHIRNNLQYWAAKDGFDNNDMVYYCKRFVKLAKQCVPKKFTKVAKPVYEMVARKKSVSDNILNKAKRKGYKSFKVLPKDFAAELALGSVETSLKRLKRTERVLKKFIS